MVNIENFLRNYRPAWIWDVTHLFILFVLSFCHRFWHNLNPVSANVCQFCALSLHFSDGTIIDLQET